MVKDYPWHLQNLQLLKAKGIGKQTEGMRSPWDLKKGEKKAAFSVQDMRRAGQAV